MQLEHQGGVGIYIASTGALDHWKEEIFRSGAGGPCMECWREEASEFAPKLGEQATKVSSAACQ